jgi:hypothetical protein
MSPMRRSRISRILWNFVGSGLDGSIRLNAGLIDEHNGDVILDGIDAVASDTLQALSIRCELDIGFAQRTSQDFQKLRV